MLNKLKGLFGGKSLAMDLGTANTLIFSPEAGVVVNEPSVVAVDTYSEKIIAVGREAKGFMGRTPDRIRVYRPIRDGVIADYEVTRQMIALFIQQASKKLSIFKPLVVVCVPMGITAVEKRAVVEAGKHGGAREVLLIEEPMAAAIGADLPIQDPMGSMVLDIGGGTSEVAVISMSNVAFAESIRVAGDAMNASIQRHLQEKFQILVGENMAEEAKIAIGSAVPMHEIKRMDVFGKNLINGSPTTVSLTDSDIREGIREPLSSIMATVRNALEKTSPDLVADVIDNGLLLVGGGALLTGLDELLYNEIRVKVIMDGDPLTTVVRGTGRVLDRKSGFRQALLEG